MCGVPRQPDVNDLGTCLDATLLHVSTPRRFVFLLRACSTPALRVNDAHVARLLSSSSTGPPRPVTGHASRHATRSRADLTAASRSRTHTRAAANESSETIMGYARLRARSRIFNLFFLPFIVDRGPGFQARNCTAQLPFSLRRLRTGRSSCPFSYSVSDGGYRSRSGFETQPGAVSSPALTRTYTGLRFRPPLASRPRGRH